MAVKVLTPEQLFDSLAEVTGNIRTSEKRAKGGVKGAPPKARDQFITFFLAGADFTSPLDYEAGIPQALRLMNSPVAGNPAAGRAVTAGASKPADAIARIYLATLSRRPTAEETKRLTAYADRVGAQTAYGDILWAALNSSEFSLVR